MHKLSLFKAASILILITLINSCALTSFQTQKLIMTSQVVPLSINAQSLPIIVLARPFAYSQALINYTVNDNDNIVGVITNNSYMQWETKTGNVTLILKPGVTTRCYTNDDECLNANVDLASIKTTQPVTKITFNAIAGNTYYLTLIPQWHFFTDTPGKVDITASDSIDLTKLKPPVIIIR